MATLKLPSVNAITRTISPSHGLFYSFDSQDKSNKKNSNQPVELQEVSLVGTLGSLKEGEKAQQDQKAGKEQTVSSNIQTVDTCFLIPEHDSYCLKFSVKVTALMEDLISNNEIALHKFKQFIQNYREQVGGEMLAKRYLTNFINGRFLWRNKYATNKSITLSIADQLKHTFKINLKHDFDTQFSKATDQTAFDELASILGKALLNKDDSLVLNIESSGTIGYGQEVYPSQEFVNDDKETKSKVLFDVYSQGKRIAAFHSQKLGNAIRTIDTWYAEEAQHPIPVDPFGPDKQNQTLHRTGTTSKDNSIYSLLERLLNDDVEVNSDAGHYVMACFIRGGVYSGKGKTK
jgi:CRISPR-associated protein Csy3